MTPSNPKRPRGVGRRQFSPGTDEEWEQALSQPHVRRALSDPQIQQALGQMMPQAMAQQQKPQGFADGGTTAGIPDVATIQKIQQLQDEIKSEWMPTRYAKGGAPQHFQIGGMAQQDELKRLDAIINSTDPSVTEDQKNIARQEKAYVTFGGGLGGTGFMGLSGSQLQGLSKLTGPPTAANTALPMGLAALTGLGVAGNVSPGGRIAGALLSAGIAGLGNYLIRKHLSKQTPTQSTTGAVNLSGSGSGGSSSQTGPSSLFDPNALVPGAIGTTFGQLAQSGTPQNLAPSAGISGTGGGSLVLGKDAQGNTVYSLDSGPWRNSQTGAPASGGVTNQQQVYGSGGAPGSNAASSQTAAPRAQKDQYGFTQRPPETALDRATRDYYASQGLLPSQMNQASNLDPFVADAIAQGLIPDTGYREGGEVHSDAAQDRQQTLGILKEKGLIKKRGGRAEFAKGGIADMPEPPRKPPGKDVLRRSPLGHGHLMPALVTTIVITAKPKKKEKKAAGGNIETPKSRLDLSARKPRAVPPQKGPQNGDQYAPYKKGGHVQVPRGSGVATRGKRFSGIY